MPGLSSLEEDDATPNLQFPVFLSLPRDRLARCCIPACLADPPTAKAAPPAVAHGFSAEELANEPVLKRYRSSCPDYFHVGDDDVELPTPEDVVQTA